MLVELGRALAEIALASVLLGGVVAQAVLMAAQPEQFFQQAVHMVELEAQTAVLPELKVRAV